MLTHKELLLQKELLEKQITQARKEDAGTALAQVQSLVKEYGFTAQQVFPWTPEPSKRETKKADAKYRNPQTGATWSGRGKEPRWLEGKDRSAFAIQPPEELPAGDFSRINEFYSRIGG